jgi:protein gp37
MGKTKIEWVKNPQGGQGITLNPIKGKCPMACPYCYARRMYDRFKWNPEPRWDSSVIERLRSPRKPTGIFVCSTFEWLWDESWAHNIYTWIKAFPQHRFYTLTKLPEQLPQFSPFPENCWVGVTATNQPAYDDAVYWLHQIKAPVKYISLEPLLTSVYLPNYKDVDWLIIGAQTNPYKPPEISWVREIVEAADRAGIPVFLKDNLEALFDTDIDFGIVKRQQVPEARLIAQNA